MRSVFLSPLLALLGVTYSNAELPWKDILGPPKGTVPSPTQSDVEWRTDFHAALDEAKRRKLPLLVTWRCLPCKQCAAFDKDVLDGGPELTPLLKQFITVRMTDAGRLDERYFPYRSYQDLDLSWWGYFLSPEGELYGVFGGKDHISDATRISVKAFANTMRRILAHHYDPRRKSWIDIDGPTPEAKRPQKTPRDLEVIAAFEKDRPWTKKQECIHCHQVHDLVHFESKKNGTFDLKQYTQAWPLPENVGIHLDRDDGLLVTKVVSGSAAEKIGLKPGDRLGMAGGRKLHSQADFRGALHRASYGPAEIPIAWTRDGNVMQATLRTKDNWRAGENAWRKSVYEGIIGPHMGFFPLHGPRNGKGSMSFRPFMGNAKNRKNNKWYSTGLRPNMEIVEFNGRRDDWDSRQFIAWFRLNHKAGDTITIKTRDGREFSRKIVEKQ